MKIIPLSEGAFTVDNTKVFVPFNEQHNNLKDRPIGSLLVEVQPFLVITNQDIILLDTGLGFMQNEQLQLIDNLKKHNIQPEQITKVLISHLHKDHANGISYKNEHTKTYQITFPNATYYIQENELNTALEANSSSFNTERIVCLKNANNVIKLKDDKGIIDEYIHYQKTGAHSPYHQVFWIHTENKIIFYGGDDAPQYQQMKNKFVAKYDYNGKLAMQLRQEWWQQGEKEKWIFLFYHDTKIPTFTF